MKKKLLLVLSLLIIVLCFAACTQTSCYHNFQETSKVAATCTAEGVTNYACSICGETKSETVPKTDHKYGTPQVTTPATCTSEGVQTYKCTTCDESYTKSISKKNHSYKSQVTTPATCSSYGTKTSTCSDCGDSYTTQISKTSHSYTRVVTKEPTCTTVGLETCTCTVCGQVDTTALSILGHSPNSNLICTRCGITCSLSDSMTATEKNNANAVYYISQRQVWHQDDEGRYVLVFSLMDSSENELTAPAVVEIRITNDAGETVYTATKTVKSSDFTTWSYNNGAVKKLQATIYIYDSEIRQGKSADGDIYFTVYNDGYFSFDESRLSIEDLPEKGTTILLPTLPTVIHDYNYDKSIDSSVKVTNITYEVSGDDLYIYFTGEKTYDERGNSYSQSCKIGWKLYDSEGYVVASGTCYSDAIAVGEKFRNQKEYAWDCITTGETYTLEIIHTS